MNPYLLDTPAVVSFSGGRTSGFMLWHVLQAFGGTLPADVKVVFANTGKERPETLDFVERCGQRWGVPVTWVEYRFLPGVGDSPGRSGFEKPNGEHTFTLVDYTVASRAGEPFEQAIRARRFLPNPVTRFCTVELKIRPIKKYAKSLGWDDFTMVVGMRADEPDRVRKLHRQNRDGYDKATPLATAGVSEADVLAFWKAQPFDLELETHEGNCDLCFLKGKNRIVRILRERPDLADWWVRMEETIEGGHAGTDRFRRDRPGYASLLQLAQRPGLFDAHEPDELSIACHCTD